MKSFLLIFQDYRTILRRHGLNIKASVFRFNCTRDFKFKAVYLDIYSKLFIFFSLIGKLFLISNGMLTLSKCV